jgi:hypothetical protein
MRKLTAVLVVLLSGLMLFPVFAGAQSMQVSPFKIVINAVMAEEVQVTFYESSGVNLSEGYDAKLDFGGTLVATAVGIDYCPIDNILFFYFNREEIKANCLANNIFGEVTATLSGCYTLLSGDIKDIGYRTCTVEIVMPGKSASKFSIAR